MLNPKGIAIVGASPKAGSFGDRMLRNLAGFDGDIYLVNSKYEQLGERRCFPSIASLPVIPDCVAVTVPRESAEDVVREAAHAGAGGVILYASGYATTQLPERIEQQRRLRGISPASRACPRPELSGHGELSASGARFIFRISLVPRDLTRASSVGIASQSGSDVAGPLAQAIECGASVSHAFSAGNQADVDVADLVAYLADEPTCHAIACAFEGMTYPQRLGWKPRRSHGATASRC